ncbi:molecular chaperone GrpE [Clostridium acetobutylicum]|jgi:molecular chaperone GrpE|uniref:Protein GrpE n=1 Tax=Clostridium acetobutylicum (strain ATCC 824 / DSM 792 / JCM 1419 / IAM 19013 / LMG 5710 / NBRC 13948 / NRRL B-527 / VKM B-1787 / 2291 / W) TaxID=272562 RepID=GRPE_CLOAB|nr:MULTISPECIES: nucleotide exchange factor GrpE [Clostridium]P30726.1 RecName: Full=Protein GrpE; AltName: Full=HSP-70 cofactor [Clostridium acetobutylicum ATCC 824]AAA23245.1 grpE [Clostridium acetobutylicum]AAK79252.1 Molecular chaperone GrpE [Clostridium acetobutylicum ATCC 824]ADZ20331.1 Molecular chaperone GrpE [Clostridium acetobutylicum EA 2018]AEI33318.1 heat shock protein GrpE [Clostridium acetobutylicum DSM 1731]AWV81501.1 nucleotide exchange factor GrpE [Clostridium acetobutylicum
MQEKDSKDVTMEDEETIASQEEIEVEGNSEESSKEEESNNSEISDENLSEENLKLKDENEKLKNELDAAKDRLLRLSAEYENYRNRTAKEKEGIYTDACSDVINEMLPTLDNLERAASTEGSAEDIKKGVEMVVKQFKNSLSKLGIEEIPSEGKFDPNLHNAVMHIEDEGYGENEVVEVLQKGYKRGDKVLRHSMVKVAN